MEAINVEKLNKVYVSHKKQPGVLAGIRNLFYAETIETKAVDDISFKIEEGEFVGFLGPNGAGKTTTLKMLSGIIKPTGGEVSVLGYDPWERKNEYKKQFALLMGQKNQLWWDLPVMESFLLNKKIYDIPDADFKESLDELVTLLDVSKILDIQVRKLSLGERMKCELIASLLHRPKVLFLDEPTIGLDVIAQKSMRDFLVRYNKEKKITIILTSHYMEDIERLCERIIIINQKIFYDGPLKELVDKYAKNKLLTITFENAVERKDIEGFGEVSDFDPIKVTFKIPKAGVRNVAKDILSSDLPVDDIMIDEMDIENIIRNIFEKSNEVK
ncbi:MAG: ATP-binding cassette domain-containing protein [Candidatus Moranbacteria bacterium]|nr:ATP-binding cassette domain-containing protein [Candidatus Moranbacteria bacterium]